MTHQPTPPTEAEATEAVAKALYEASVNACKTRLPIIRPAWDVIADADKDAWRAVATRSRNIWDRVLTGEEP